MADYPSPEQLLPHQGPAVLIDRIVANDKDSIEVAVNITSSHPYFSSGQGVPAWVGIEMMAQAAALHSGLTGQAEGRPPQKGMLLGTRLYQAQHPWFGEGAQLRIYARREFGASGGMAACRCAIYEGPVRQVEATIIIVEEQHE